MGRRVAIVLLFVSPPRLFQDACDGKRQGLVFLRLEWSGLLLEKMNVGRIDEPFGNDNHIRYLFIPLESHAII